FAKRSFTGQTAWRSIVVRAGHIVTADAANKLATPRFQPLRANRAKPRGIFPGAFSCFGRMIATLCGRRNCIAPQTCRSWFLLPGFLHGLSVIAQPQFGGKRRGARGPVPANCGNVVRRARV